MSEGEIITRAARWEARNPLTRAATSVIGAIRKELRQNWQLLLMVLPGVIVVFIVNYMPMPGIILAFKDYKASKGIWGSDWVGLRNFEFLFSSGTAWQLIRNTVALNFLF